MRVCVLRRELSTQGSHPRTQTHTRLEASVLLCTETNTHSHILDMHTCVHVICQSGMMFKRDRDIESERALYTHPHAHSRLHLHKHTVQIAMNLEKFDHRHTLIPHTHTHTHTEYAPTHKICILVWHANQTNGIARCWRISFRVTYMGMRILSFKYHARSHLFIANSTFYLTNYQYIWRTLSIYIYECMYIFAYTQTHRLAWCCKRSYQCIYTQMCVYMHTHTLTLALLIGMMLQKIVWIQIYTNMYTYMNVHFYTRTLTHTHTNTYTNAHQTGMMLEKINKVKVSSMSSNQVFVAMCIYTYVWRDISQIPVCLCIWGGWVGGGKIDTQEERSTPCNTLLHTATHWVGWGEIDAQEGSTHCNTLQHTGVLPPTHGCVAARLMREEGEEKVTERWSERERERELFFPRCRDECVRSASMCVQ